MPNTSERVSTEASTEKAAPSTNTQQPTRMAFAPPESDAGAASQPVHDDERGTLPWTPPSIQKLLERRGELYSIDEQTKAWSEVAEVVKIYSDDTIRRWNGEIDTYLVYAGLFSAILTAFNVQSYILLQPAPPDPAVIALQQISAQLSSFSTSPPFINSTHPAFRQTDTPPPPIPRTAVWLNALWFSSLILSLSSASVGIMVKQWMNEYSSGISSGTSRKTAQLRQYRLDNLMEWRVRHIVMAIPILLQLSLALFLAGLLTLLWTLDYIVATIASVLIGLLVSFVLTTMVLPLIKPGCCYLSPQTLALYVLYERVAHALKYLRYHSFRLLIKPVQCAYDASSGTAQRVCQMIGHFLWLCRGRNPRSGNLQTWRGREQSIIRTREDILDVDLIAMAYGTTMDPEILSLAGICLSDVKPTTVIRCFERLHDADVHFFGSQSPFFAHVGLSITSDAANNLWINTAICLLSQSAESRDERWRTLLDVLDGYLTFAMTFGPPRRDRRHVEWGLMTLSSIASDASSLPSSGMVDTALSGVSGMLSWAALEGAPLDSAVVGHAATAADLRLCNSSDTSGWTGICSQVQAVTTLLKCTTSMMATPRTSGSDRKLILSCAHNALRRVTTALQKVDLDDVSAHEKSAHSHSIPDLVDFLVNNHSSLYSLVTQDLVSALEHAMTLIQRVAREQGLPDTSEYHGTMAAIEQQLKQRRVIKFATEVPA